MDNNLQVLYPALVPAIIAGALVGLVGYLGLTKASRASSPAPAWRMSFASFFIMNASALACHCLTPRESSLKRPLAALDVAGTAGCALAAILAVATDELRLTDHAKQGSGAPRLQAPGKVAQRRDTWLASVLVRSVAAGWAAFACLLATAYLGAHTAGIPELLYIFTSVAAALRVGRYIIRNSSTSSHNDSATAKSPASDQAAAASSGRSQTQRRLLRRWAWLAIGGGVIALSGVPLDAVLCRTVGPHVNHVTVLFLGCDVIMLGLYGFVRTAMSATGGGQGGKSKAA